MLTLTQPDKTELELVIGYSLTCSSCTKRIFIDSDTTILETLKSAGWQRAETDHEYLPCVCPKCVGELKDNEQELKEIY
ncbi:hypothetical protein ACWAU3_10475 [Shewanella sp. JL219SE-S6]